ncbi:hypothetical protein ABET51_01055 [Metabacillus fastidiosus]|uniref:hypothetical protein n=1 Tax=Metabacillus fastidiosus TaxID=1458 RepID=UPI002E1E2D31|nr:hypothetical protein [Metabacillus fastidiosus]
MKIIIRAILISAVLHAAYFSLTFLEGYIITKAYVPGVGKDESVYMLQNEVTFGFVGNPFIFVYSFIALAFTCFIIQFVFQKLTRKGSFR